jgi:hypothetical protein
MKLSTSSDENLSDEESSKNSESEHEISFNPNILFVLEILLGVIQKIILLLSFLLIVY